MAPINTPIINMVANQKMWPERIRQHMRTKKNAVVKSVINIAI